MKGDLHMHSHYSDGMLSPRALMEKAKQAGCDMVALTDHDTVDGVAEATESARALGMENIAGTEISCYAGCKVHILGYGMRCDDPRFLAFLCEQQDKRADRAEKLLENLAKHGMPVPRELLAGSVSREISRVHIAMAMVQLGYERDYYTAFVKWLKSGTPTYAPLNSPAPEVAIEHIHAAGGLAVLAHPVRIDLDPYERTKLIRRLADAGLDGIEAVYKRSSRAAVKGFRELAAKLDLFVTAGADYHGGDNEIIARPLSAALCKRLGA